jgi:hypothetical protein
MFIKKTGLTLFFEKMKLDLTNTGMYKGLVSKLELKSWGIVIYLGSHFLLTELY